MKNSISLTALMVALALPGAALAQASTAFDGVDAAGDRVDDIQDAVQDDFERSTDRGTFGNTGRVIGWYGSVSGTATATSGNTDTASVGIGSRFGYFDGTNGHDFTFSYTYGEDEGDTNANSFLGSYEYTRDLTDRTFAFGDVTYAYDEFGSFEQDAFAGGGIGYRVFATRDVRWDVKSGVGYRYLEDATGDSVDEAALQVSSNYLNYLAEGVFLTNDTDILYSDTDTRVLNDLGVNVALNDGLALRTSLLTEYHTDPLPGLDDTDTTLGLSVVYNFN